MNSSDSGNVIFEFLGLKPVFLYTKIICLCRLEANLLDKYAKMLAILNFKMATIDMQIVVILEM